MPKWLHRTDKTLLNSIASADLPEPVANYIEEPDLSTVTGFPSKYWTITGDVVSLLSQAERDVIDAAILEAARDSTASQIDTLEDIFRAFALALLDELNLHATRVTALLDAIDNANNLASVKSAVALIPDIPQRTIAQMKTAIRGKLGS